MFFSLSRSPLTALRACACLPHIKIKRHREEDAELSHRSKRLLAGSGDAIVSDPNGAKQVKKSKAKVLNLPRELRDAIYSLLTQDTSCSVHRGRRDPVDLGSNTWEIGYVHGPALSLLLVSKQ